jgi:hypothetical protein
VNLNPRLGRIGFRELRLQQLPRNEAADEAGCDYSEDNCEDERRSPGEEPPEPVGLHS